MAQPVAPPPPPPPGAPPPAPPPLDAPLDPLRLDALVAQGWTSRTGFLGAALARAALAEARALRAQDALHPAGVSRDALRDVSVRGDHITWLSHHPDAPALAAVSARFAGLRAQLNRTLWLGLTDQEIQIACYPGDGTGYARHVDALQGSLNRRVTAICYVNEGWLPAHGGALRLWTSAGEVLIEPTLDTLLVFFSDRVPHAVESAFAERWAVTAWLRTVDPSRPAL